MFRQQSCTEQRVLEGTFRDARSINPIGGFPENEMTGAMVISSSLL